MYQHKREKGTEWFDLNQEDLNKIKKELTREGMILYLTTEVKYPANPYKIIHHKNGTKAVIFK